MHECFFDFEKNVKDSSQKSRAARRAAYKNPILVRKSDKKHLTSTRQSQRDVKRAYLHEQWLRNIIEYEKNAEKKLMTLCATAEAPTELCVPPAEAPPLDWIIVDVNEIPGCIEGSDGDTPTKSWIQCLWSVRT